MLSLVKPPRIEESQMTHKKREKKMHAKTEFNSIVTKEESHLYKHISENYPKLKVLKSNEFQNFYVWKEKVLNDINGSMMNLKQRY